MTRCPGDAPRIRRIAIVQKAVAAAALAIIALVVIAAALAAANYPALTGQIVDNANLLKPEDRAAILTELQSLEGTSTDQVAIVTVPSLDGLAIEDYGIGLARQWQIGQKNKDNGILLIVAPNERKVRIEVGRRLEPVMTDTMSKIIIENAMLPKFRRGDFSGGIRDGVRDIKAVLLGDAEAVKERARGGRTPQDDPTLLIHLLLFALI
ncbi:MAG: TPM domain-containing protein, partial [Hyphomicrobium sp.]